MKKFYYSPRKFTVFILFSMILYSTSAQNVVNNGNGIVINQGAWLVIGGNFINMNGGQDGFVDIDGKMVVNRDFINNAANEVFVSIEASPDGETILNGSSTQNISGTTSTRFENLTIKNSRKVMQTDFCQVAGKLTVQAILDLNSNTFVIDNPATSGISYQSGYILSETEPSMGLGIILWSTGNSTGTYQIPFGSGNASENDLNLTVNITSAGNDNGFFSFSTYPTSVMNMPYPPAAGSLSPFEPSLVADRFWLVQPSYTTIPSAIITFMYDYASVHDINRSTLKAIRCNGISGAWNDWGPAGTSNINQYNVVTPVINPSDFHSWWTLSGEVQAEYIYIPNAFTPNGDGFNDDFKPSINGYEPENYKMYIFNRWGNQIFETSDLMDGWNGTYEESESPQDVYVWLILYDDLNKQQKSKTGIVTLIR
jgi:gliding motility-associated-like protein